MMPRLTEQVHSALARVVRPGDVVVDATAGNGHDTLALAQLVGPTGRVFAFDIQLLALRRTAELLAPHGSLPVTLELRDHAEMPEVIPVSHHGQLAAVVFNLGYLPHGEKSIVTRPETTIVAIRAAAKLLRPGGLLSIMTYPGHPGGWEEEETISTQLQQLEKEGWIIQEIASEPGVRPGPKLWLVMK
jgi:predicted methyltransferase